MQLVNHAQADMSLSRFGLCYWTKSILLSFCQLGPKEPPLQPSQPDEEEDEEEDANVNSPHQTESELIGSPGRGLKFGSQSAVAQTTNPDHSGA